MEKEIDKYQKYLTVEKDFYIGEVYWVKDKYLNFPDTDRLEVRKVHEGRTVVIIENNSNNANPLHPFIIVAPTTSVLDYKRPNDIILTPEEDNVLKESLLLLSLIQPVLKIDLEDCVCTISDEKIKQTLAIVGETFGLIDF